MSFELAYAEYFSNPLGHTSMAEGYDRFAARRFRGNGAVPLG